VTRSDPLLPNALIVARREYFERVRSRLFHASTVLLATLAVLVAFVPIFVKAIDRGTTTTIAVVAADDQLAERSVTIMAGVLNGQAGAEPGSPAPYSFVRVLDRGQAIADIGEGRFDAALIADRTAEGRIDFQFFTGDNIGPDRTELISVGTLAVAILDWTATNNPSDVPFQMPSLNVIAAIGPSAGGAPISSADFAGRRILGIVFIVLLFIIVVIYGMWVAAGVVAEKSSRVMELIISAASARQLLVGKVLGIGGAGLTQYFGILIPAIIALALEDRVATAVFGPNESIAPSLVALTPQLFLAYGAFFTLGFTLYALIYAAVGSLVSRPEDLQTIALPLSLVAIVGYLMAVLALTGGTPGFIRFASLIPFWSPFIMTTRLIVGRVEPWELVVSYGLLILTIGVVLVIATRIYAAGVLLYGQRPGLGAIIRAVRHPV
jgi:ABC-2 type transport system permease protein